MLFYVRKDMAGMRVNDVFPPRTAMHAMRADTGAGRGRRTGERGRTLAARMRPGTERHVNSRVIALQGMIIENNNEASNQWMDEWMHGWMDGWMDE